MITVKMADLLNSTDTLQKLAGKELKAKLAFSIARLLKAADKEIQQFNETRMNLIQKHGEKNEKGDLLTDDKGNCKIMPDSIDTFSNELNELIATEVELNANPLKIDMLEDLDFTPGEMSALEPFIEFDEE